TLYLALGVPLTVSSISSLLKLKYDCNISFSFSVGSLKSYQIKVADFGISFKSFTCVRDFSEVWYLIVILIVTLLKSFSLFYHEIYSMYGLDLFNISALENAFTC